MSLKIIIQLFVQMVRDGGGPILCIGVLHQIPIQILIQIGCRLLLPILPLLRVLLVEALSISSSSSILSIQLSAATLIAASSSVAVAALLHLHILSPFLSKLIAAAILHIMSSVLLREAILTIAIVDWRQIPRLFEVLRSPIRSIVLRITSWSASLSAIRSVSSILSAIGLLLRLLLVESATTVRRHRRLIVRPVAVGVIGHFLLFPLILILLVRVHLPFTGRTLGSMHPVGLSLHAQTAHVRANDLRSRGIRVLFLGFTFGAAACFGRHRFVLRSGETVEARGQRHGGSKINYKQSNAQLWDRCGVRSLRCNGWV